MLAEVPPAFQSHPEGLLLYWVAAGMGGDMALSQHWAVQVRMNVRALGTVVAGCGAAGVSEVLGLAALRAEHNPTLVLRLG